MLPHAHYLILFFISQEDLEKLLIAERQKIEDQREEVLRLQKEYEKSRETVAKQLDHKQSFDDDSVESKNFFFI